MTNFKEELAKAKAANDWDRVQVLWTELCGIAEIEETSDGIKGESEAMADRRNKQDAGQVPGGKKI